VPVRKLPAFDIREAARAIGCLPLLPGKCGPDEGGWGPIGARSCCDVTLPPPIRLIRYETTSPLPML
jgi:hypothetical protein